MFRISLKPSLSYHRFKINLSQTCSYVVNYSWHSFETFLEEALRNKRREGFKLSDENILLRWMNILKPWKRICRSRIFWIRFELNASISNRVCWNNWKLQRCLKDETWQKAQHVNDAKLYVISQNTSNFYDSYKVLISRFANNNFLPAQTKFKKSLHLLLSFFESEYLTPKTSNHKHDIFVMRRQSHAKRQTVDKSIFHFVLLSRANLLEWILYIKQTEKCLLTLACNFLHDISSFIYRKRWKLSHSDAACLLAFLSPTVLDSISASSVSL